MRLQTLAQELEFKVVNAVLLDYLNGWTQRDWHEIALSDSALVTRMRAVVHAPQPRDSLTLSRVSINRGNSRRPSQSTSQVDLATMTPAEYGRHVEQFEGAANDDGSLLYNAARIPALQNHRALLQCLSQGSKRAVMLSKYTSDPSHTFPIYPVRRITSSRPQAADDKTSIGSPGLPRPQPFFPSRFPQPSMQSSTELVKADALATTMDERNGMRGREGVAGFMSHGFVSAFFVGSHREAVPFALVSARASSRVRCNAS
ncbi:BQ5605_C010g05907 [Microbotryum silenes-dioicae]|uniref:BQ5605_C010g05907 protein n=1 Tax=Microbotryum silenes-dioicae TaxID=796604 RepID=A0A2X0LUD9_9BASI|nr:BQ5605_C010g05907 [Microbotryum silenes-dioicae]